MLYREIGITDIEGVLVGHAQRKELGSGCTAVLVEKGALCGCDVRGGSPATRDTQALRSEMSNQKIYGVVLTGGSAYGLNTCTGVMNYLTERGAFYLDRRGKGEIAIQYMMYSNQYGLLGKTGEAEAFLMEANSKDEE